MTIILSLAGLAALLALSHWATWSLADHRGSCRGWAERGRLDGRFINDLMASAYHSQAEIARLAGELRRDREGRTAGTEIRATGMASMMVSKSEVTP